MSKIKIGDIVRVKKEYLNELDIDEVVALKDRFIVTNSKILGGRRLVEIEDTKTWINYGMYYDYRFQNVIIKLNSKIKIL